MKHFWRWETYSKASFLIFMQDSSNFRPNLISTCSESFEEWQFLHRVYIPFYSFTTHSYEKRFLLWFWGRLQGAVKTACEKKSFILFSCELYLCNSPNFLNISLSSFYIFTDTLTFFTRYIDIEEIDEVGLSVCFSLATSNVCIR